MLFTENRCGILTDSEKNNAALRKTVSFWNVLSFLKQALDPSSEILFIDHLQIFNLTA